MNPEHLTDILTRAGASLGIDHHGHLVTHHLPDELATLVATHADELTLAVRGRATDHRWCRCTDCGQTTLTVRPTPSKERVCYLTPRCTGKLTVARPHRTPTDITVLEPATLTCSRPGCDRPAARHTAGHQPLCTADFTHYAQWRHHHP